MNQLEPVESPAATICNLIQTANSCCPRMQEAWIELIGVPVSWPRRPRLSAPEASRARPWMWRFAMTRPAGSLFGMGNCPNARGWSQAAAAVITLGAGLVPALEAQADAILDFYGASWETYLATSKTAVQDVRPLVDQRGIFLDGTLRAAPLWPLALAGNPWSEAFDASNKFNGVRLDTGTYDINDADLVLRGPVNLVIGRSYNARQKDSGGSYFTSNGPMGKNWFASWQPELVKFAGATNDLDVMYLVYGADRFIEFKRQQSNSNQWKAKNGAAGALNFTAASGAEPETYTYLDENGFQMVFFGGDTNAGVAAWQVW